MPSAFVLLECIGKAAVKNVVNLFSFGVGGDILVDAWDYWQRVSREEERAAEVQAVAQMSAAELRDAVARIVREEAAALPAEQQAQVASYLGQVPAAVRRSLRRPSDPSGTTIAAGTVFRKPEDLLPLLPASLPRFRRGDRPPGIGDWELVELLGVGGFGEVWKARNSYMPDPIALKFCLDAKAAEWLRNEAKLLGRIMSQGKHPGIVRLLNTFLSADTPCLEYEYVDGGDLAGFIQERRNGLSAEQAARWIKALAEIVGFAHRVNPPIVHRDLKPANILLKSRPDGKLAPRITDFGIGGLAIEQAVARSRPGTKSGEFLTAAVRGSYTPLYASPQQMRGEAPDPRDDVYALGVIWYQLLTGDLTTGRPGGDAWRKRLADRGMTPALLSLLASSFEDERRDRPDTAVVLAEKLKRLLPSPVEDILEVIPGEPVPMAKPRPAPQPKTQQPQMAEPVRSPVGTEQKRVPQGPKKDPQWSWAWGLLIACTLAGVALIGGVVLIIHSLSTTARTDHLNAARTNNLKQLVIGMQQFQETHAHLPLAGFSGEPWNGIAADKKPLLSWRVAILPFVEQAELYKQFKLDEPWDSPHNSKLLAKMPQIYKLRGDDRTPSTHTHYQVFTGEGTVFDPRAAARIPATISDGTSNTILIVEAERAVPWTKPEDVAFDLNKPIRPLLSTYFPGDFLVGLVDGTVKALKRDVSETTLHLAICPNDGFPMPADW